MTLRNNVTNHTHKDTKNHDPALPWSTSPSQAHLPENFPMIPISISNWEVRQYHFVADEMAASLETKAANISHTNCVKVAL